jgi:hypothetical protein
MSIFLFCYNFFSSTKIFPLWVIMRSGLPSNQVCFFLCLQECSRFGFKMLQGLFSSMCFREEVFRSFQSHLHLRAWHQAIFNCFLVVFSIKGFLIRIVGCTRKGKWEGVDGMVCWECVYVGIWAQHIVPWQFSNNYGSMTLIGGSNLSLPSKENGCGYLWWWKLHVQFSRRIPIVLPIRS